MKLPFTLLFAATLLLSACSKDDDTVPMLLGQYRSESTIKAGTMQLYTSSGVSTNQTIINRFLRRLNVAPTAFLRRDSTITGAPLELNFRENNRVTMAYVVPPGADDHMMELEVTTRARQHYILSGLDSLTSYTSSVYGNNQNPCNVFPQKIREHQPAKHCLNTSISAGYEQMCRFRPLWVLNFRNGQPVIPLFSWLGKSTSNGRWCWTATSSDWNSPNPNLRSSLAPGDTVVVQANEVALRKQ
jgi:hypothetical protein